MKVFLTGATGYIGGTVAEALQTAGHQVIGLARSEQAAQSLAAVGIEVVRGDLHQPLEWIEVLWLSNTHVRQLLDWQPIAPSLLEELELGS